jgi:hypothetical protein
VDSFADFNIHLDDRKTAMSIIQDDPMLVSQNDNDTTKTNTMSSDDEEERMPLPMRKRAKTSAIPKLKAASPQVKGTKKPVSKKAPTASKKPTTLPKKQPKVPRKQLASKSKTIPEDEDAEDEVFKATLDNDDDDEEEEDADNLHCDEEFHAADSDDLEEDANEFSSSDDNGTNATFYRQVDNDRKLKAHKAKQGHLKLVDDEAEDSDEDQEIERVQRAANEYLMDDFVRPDGTIIREKKSSAAPPSTAQAPMSMLKRKIFPLSDEDADDEVPAKMKPLSSMLPSSFNKKTPNTTPTVSPTTKGRTLPPATNGSSPKGKAKFLPLPMKSTETTTSSSPVKAAAPKKTASSPPPSATKKRKAPAKNEVPEVRSTSEEHYNLGTTFKYNKVEYAVTYRGLSSAFDKNKNKYLIDQCVPNMFTTCEVVGSKPKKYAVFLIYPFKTPHLVTEKDAITIENKLSDAEKKTRLELAKACNNLEVTPAKVPGGPPSVMARLLMFPKMYEDKLKRGDKSQFIKQTKSLFSNKCKEVMDKVLSELLQEDPEYLRQLFATHDKHWKKCRAHDNDHDIVVDALKTFEKKTIQVLAVYLVFVSDTYRAKIPPQLLELAEAMDAEKGDAVDDSIEDENE